MVNRIIKVVSVCLGCLITALPCIASGQSMTQTIALPIASVRCLQSTPLVPYQEEYLGQKVTPSGYVIQHQSIDLQLTGSRINKLDIFKVVYEGEFCSMKQRADEILRRLHNAFDIMEDDSTAYLAIGTANSDDQELPAIYLRNHWAGPCEPEGLLIMKVFEEDASKYTRGKSQASVARYILSQISAHFALFYSMRTDAIAINNLTIVKQTREGDVLLDLYLKALSYSQQITPMNEVTLESIQASIDMTDIDQRRRLNTLAHVIPIDWN